MTVSEPFPEDAVFEARIRPGIPDDDNRSYLPESLKGTDLVVNENGNNSQPFPSRLVEHAGVIADGVTDVWYTYVPESYDPAVPAPLVISLHGGLMTGWGQAVYSSWINVADREGFIVVFPTAGSHRMWTLEIAPDKVAMLTQPNDLGLYLEVPPENVDDNHDIRFILGLIDRLAAEFHIDRGRIYMQGMSMGDAMTALFARNFGNVLAGAAGSAGLTDPDLIVDQNGFANRAGPVPIWQSRMGFDTDPTLYGDDTLGVIQLNLRYWLEVNGATDLPEIAVRGIDNFAFYRGVGADVVFRDVYGRDHGQTFDDAELVWDYLFSGTRRRDDGTIERGESLLARRGDPFAVAVADGKAMAWVSGERRELSTAAFVWRSLKYHGMDGATQERGAYLYVPLDFLASVFSAELAVFDDGASSTLTLGDGRVLRFARAAVGVVRDGRITAMPAEAVMRDGRLCIPLEWFANQVMELRTSSRDGVLYVTDHYSQLSTNMARLLSDLLT